MENQGIIEYLKERLQLNIATPRPRYFMRKWRNLAERIDHLRKDVNIALVGKYTKLQDSYASVTKALEHASIQTGFKLNLTVNILFSSNFKQTMEILTWFFLWFQYIEAAHLEEAMKAEDPVIYHSAWQQLCKSE